MNSNGRVVLEVEHFNSLLASVREEGYRVVGPTVREGAIVYDDVTSSLDLPVGLTDEQDGGTYRLEKRSDDAYFGYNVGPHSWKKYLFPPVQKLFKVSQNGHLNIEETRPEPEKLAFLGVRSCELHGIFVQDRVFIGGPYVDPVYADQRANIFVIAVNCGTAGGTCFCVSMNTGPKVDKAFDLALTEVIDSARHYFVLDIGSSTGAAVMARVPHRDARDDESAAADRVVSRTAGQMGREMESGDVKELLFRNLDHPRWDDVASRCLSCGNCTMVCPTCFCSTIEDSTDLTGGEAVRTREWDSCFTMDHSYIHGGSVRKTPKSRYRQWMTHKLSTWIDQFGTSGCVGCGRCITWCPVGIDITEEVRAIRETEDRQSTQKEQMKHGNA
jgi:ferredoxin